ncbi:ABC transporter substrate-binding protein [Micromonospora craniellae]|nr:ABC transporter substrate-binding protein [Micromonospora craniellae]QOC94746.1 ABC transporter substrate-binding protein [Micromonospora craniellae]
MSISPPSVRHAVAAGVALVAGCGSESGDQGQSTSSASTAAGFRVTLTHKVGRAEVEVPPQGVVALLDADLDALLLLGVQPVGSSESSVEGGVTGWAWPLRVSKPEVLVTGDTGFGAEKIAALAPDLILTGDYCFDDEYAKLSKVAPTMGYETTGAFEDASQGALRQVAKAVGRTVRAELVHHRGRGQDRQRPRPTFRHWPARSSHSAGCGRPARSGALRSDKDASEKILNDFGLKLAPEVAAIPGDEFAVQLSLEKVTVLDADVTPVYHADKTLQPTLEGNTSSRTSCRSGASPLWP